MQGGCEEGASLQLSADIWATIDLSKAAESSQRFWKFSEDQLRLRHTGRQKDQLCIQSVFSSLFFPSFYLLRKF